MTPSIIICGCCIAADDPGIGRLRRKGWSVRRCSPEENLLDQVIQFRPRAVVYHVRSSADLGILRLLRRIDPALPLILVTQLVELAEQRLLQSVRPTFVAVAPAEADEIVQALENALASPRNAPA
jgi:DNA-binding NarL/FixJ family response regulator